MNAVAKLCRFIEAYTGSLSEILEGKNRTTLPHHADATLVVMVAQAADGFVVTYQPHPEHDGHPDIEPVVTGFDYSDVDLNTYCQSFSARFLRVAYPELGKPFKPPQPTPDVPREKLIPETFGCLLNPEIHRELQKRVSEGNLAPVSFPAIQASPIVHYEEGIAKEVVPCRFKVWSPVVEVPEIGTRRLYHWTHADLWWFPERLNLDPAQAHELALRDVLALQTVLAGSKILTPEEAKDDTADHAAEILERQCEEFLSLLAAFANNEERLHQWLNRPEHRLFLHLDHVKIWSKLPFGDKTSDFVIRCADGRYKLVEIERADFRLFTRRKAQPTSEFTTACQQVRDWQRYVRENVHTVRAEQKLEGIYEPSGVVIMGRSKDIDSDQARKRWRDMKNNFEHEVFTYDDLCEGVRSLAASLRRLRTDL